MRLKANLHMHTNDDPADPVAYSFQEAVDHAASHGFDVLAITCHDRAAWTAEYASYAAGKGILLIGGAELSVAERPGGRAAHVLLLGVDAEAERIRTFADLAAYRAAHPEALIIAPHPFFYGSFSLHDFFDAHAELFDAVEHSWFYSRRFNRNHRAVEAARRRGLPLVATSDTHFLDFMHDNYSMIDAEEKSVAAVLDAVRHGRVELHTKPRRLFREMLAPQAAFSARTLYTRAVRRHKRKPE